MANTDYIGKIIGVKIDRELGSKHPKHGFIYPVNYGFIPNTISGDGEEIDCYVLGVFEPIKLVIIPKDKNYSNDAIEALVEFQERFFEHIIIR